MDKSVKRYQHGYLHGSYKTPLVKPLTNPTKTKPLTPKESKRLCLTNMLRSLVAVTAHPIDPCKDRNMHKEKFKTSRMILVGQRKRALILKFDNLFGYQKQNSPEAKPLGCEHLVGVRRFELLTSSVSGKRSPPELNAQMERTTGLEPATPTLARLCSTN